MVSTLIKIKNDLKVISMKLLKKNRLFIESGTSIIPLKILKRKSYLIGRGVDSSNEIVINSMELSRIHATIERKKLDYYIIDNFSKNGTFLNGEKLAPGIPYILIHNDNIEMGDVTIKYLRQ